MKLVAIRVIDGGLTLVMGVTLPTGNWFIEVSRQDSGTLAIYQDPRQTMDHLLEDTKSLTEMASSARKQQRFKNTLPALDDGLIRIPLRMCPMSFPYRTSA